MAKHSTALDFDGLATFVLGARRRHRFLSLVSRLFPPLTSRWGRLHRWLKIDPDAAEYAQSESEERMFLAMVASMTPLERRNPNLIDRPRRQRIAAGSGVALSDVSAAVTSVVNWTNLDQN